MTNTNEQLNSAQAAVDRINASTEIQNLYKAFGVSPVQPERAPVWEVRRARKQEKLELAQYAAQKEIGAPGTNMVDGRLQIEHNPRLYPRFARGRLSRPGIMEEHYRVEPIAYKSINETNSLVGNATFEPVYPDGVDEKTREISERAHLAIMNVKGGIEDTLANMCTAFKLGFATHEKRWQVKEKGTGNEFHCIYALPFREQATVDKWLFDERQSELLGCEFEARTGVTSYTLPRGGGTPATERLLVVNINATGNNVEGVSPLRVTVGLRKLKELILQIAGVSVQKYGTPILQIVDSLVDVPLGEAGGAPTAPETARLVSNLQNMRATIAPVVELPPGKRLEFATPTNDQPDVTPLLEYIDAMIALCFHNEGALLGSQSFGSYAMSKTSDNKFMRAAVVPASRIAVAFTELLHDHIRFNHPDPDSIEVWPKYGFRFAGTQDSSAWTEDMAKLVTAQVWDWPDEARHMAAANMGLSVEAFDNWKTTTAAIEAGPDGPSVTVDDAQPGQVENVAQTAMNGAQITSMVDVVQQVAAGALPADAAVKILVRGFNMSNEEAQALVNDANTADEATAAKAQGINSGGMNE